MSTANNTQLTSASGYDTKRMVFSEPQNGTIPGSQPPISYKRINISTLNEDGSIGDLIIPTEELFSFGVSENKDPNSQAVNGHVLPLCLWDRDGATPEQEAWVETFNAVVERCKKHLIKHKEEIEQYELTMNDLKKFNPLYWKKEKGKIVEGRGPTLYGKLIASKKQGKILTQFYNENDEKLDPMTLLGKYCYAKSAVKIESIFIGNKISLQVKIYESTVRIMENGMKRLLPRPKGGSRMLTQAASNPMAANAGNDSDAEDAADAGGDNSDAEDGNESDAGSIVASDDEEEAPKPKPAKKKVVRKVTKVRKVKKST